MVCGVADEETHFDARGKDYLFYEKIEVFSASGVENLTIWEENVEKVYCPNHERSIFDRKVKIIVIFVYLQPQKIQKQHEAKDEGKEASPLHNLKVGRIMRTVLQDILEIDLKRCKTIHIPSRTPQI